MIEYFDSHTHLQFPQYNKDREELIKNTLESGIGFVNVGINKQTSREALELAEEYGSQPVYATAGLHPIHTHEGGEEEMEKFDYDFFKNLASSEKIVAIGECGLDYFRIKNNESRIKGQQRKAFEEQIKLASEIKKPLMIHCREAYEDLIVVIENSNSTLPNPPGIAHFFAGTEEEAEKLLDLGFYFTFGGVITLTRDYDEVVKMIPDDKLLLETDAPYVAPKKYRGKRNTPLYVKETYERVSKLRDISLEELKKQVLKNNEKVFGINI